MHPMRSDPMRWMPRCSAVLFSMITPSSNATEAVAYPHDDVNAAYQNYIDARNSVWDALVPGSIAWQDVARSTPTRTEDEMNGEMRHLEAASHSAALGDARSFCMIVGKRIATIHQLADEQDVKVAERFLSVLLHRSEGDLAVAEDVVIPFDWWPDHVDRSRDLGPETSACRRTWDSFLAAMAQGDAGAAARCLDPMSPISSRPKQTYNISTSSFVPGLYSENLLFVNVGARSQADPQIYRSLVLVFHRDSDGVWRLFVDLVVGQERA